MKYHASIRYHLSHDLNNYQSFLSFADNISRSKISFLILQMYKKKAFFLSRLLMLTSDQQELSPPN